MTETTSEFPAENIHNLNKEKRIKLIDNYYASLPHAGEKIAASSCNDAEKNFENNLLNIKYPDFDESETLIETCIRYLILYLEEYDYDLKLRGILLLDHLLANITPSKLNVNMRSNLIFDTLQRYLNDKDSLAFLDKTLGCMCALLNTIETKYSNNEHQYKRHSLILDSLLNNCFMTSNNSVKCVYLDKLPFYLRQMGVFSVRHLERLLTISFECVESNAEKVSFDFEKQEILLVGSLELLECIVDVCRMRIHAHARRIINFLLRLIYFASLVDAKDYANIEQLDSFRRLSCLMHTLFVNEKIKEDFYAEFSQLKSHTEVNSHFLKLIGTF